MNRRSALFNVWSHEAFAQPPVTVDLYAAVKVSQASYLGVALVD